MAEISQINHTLHTSNPNQLRIFISKHDGRITIPTNSTIVCTPYSFISPRIEKSELKIFQSGKRRSSMILGFSTKTPRLFHITGFQL